MFAGSGALTFADGTGNATVNASGGNSTLTAGSGSDLFVFRSMGASPTELINNFGANTNVQLKGYSAGEAAADLAKAVVGSGGVVVTLSDNTRITFANLNSTAPLAGHFTST